MIAFEEGTTTGGSVALDTWTTARSNNGVLSRVPLRIVRPTPHPWFVPARRPNGDAFPLDPEAEDDTGPNRRPYFGTGEPVVMNGCGLSQAIISSARARWSTTRGWFAVQWTNTK